MLGNNATASTLRFFPSVGCKSVFYTQLCSIERHRSTRNFPKTETASESDKLVSWSWILSRISVSVSPLASQILTSSDRYLRGDGRFLARFISKPHCIILRPYLNTAPRLVIDQNTKWYRNPPFSPTRSGVIAVYNSLLPTTYANSV